MSIGSGDIKIAVNIQNQAKLKELTADLRHQEDQVRKLASSYKGIAGGQQQFVKASIPLAQNIRTTTKEIEKLKASTRSMEPGRFGLGLMALGNLTDDLQYGFRSIVNNIPQVVYMMGGSAGLAGGVAIASVAINQLMEHWDELTNRFKSLTLNIPLDQLEKMRVRAEKAGEAFEKLSKTPSEFQAREMHAIEAAMVKGGGPGKVFQGVAEAVSQDPGLSEQLTDEQKKRMAYLRDVVAGKQKMFQGQFLGLGMGSMPPGPNPPAFPGPFDPMGFRQPMAQGKAAERAHKEINELTGAIQEANRKKAKDIQGGSLIPGEEGDGFRQTLRRLMRKFPDAFSSEFRHAMEHASPKAIQYQMDRDTQNPQDRAEASRFFQSHLGARAIMGEAMELPPRGPLGKNDAINRIRQHPLMRRLNPRAREDIAKHLEGLSAEQADEVMRRMTPHAIQGEAEKNFAGHVAPASADLMRRTAEQVRKSGPLPPKQSAFEMALEKQMKAAGALGDVKGVMREMKAVVEEQIRDVMMERGISRQEAQGVLLRGRLPKQPSQFFGLADFAKMTMTGTLNNAGQMQRRQLDEITMIRKWLQDNVRKGLVNVPPAAVAANPP